MRVAAIAVIAALAGACGSSSSGKIDGSLGSGSGSAISASCVDLVESSGSAQLVDYKYALVDVGAPASLPRFTALLSDPVGVVTSIVAACPSGLTCSGLSPSPVAYQITSEGQFTADGRLIVFCGTSTGYWKTVSVTVY